MRSKKAMKAHRDRQRKLRASRQRKKLCLTCGDPVAISTRTGKRTKQCAIHLKIDADRKAIETSPKAVSKKIIRPKKKVVAAQVGRDRDRDRVRLIRIDEEMVYPLTRKDITGGTKFLMLSKLPVNADGFPFSRPPSSEIQDDGYLGLER